MHQNLFPTSKSTIKFEVFHPTSKVAEVKWGLEKQKCPNFNSDTTFNNEKTVLIFKNVIGMFLRCTNSKIWINSLRRFGVNKTFCYVLFRFIKRQKFMTYDSYSIIKQGLFSQNPPLVPQFRKNQLSTFMTYYAYPK